MTMDRIFSQLRCPHSQTLLVRDGDALVCVDGECRMLFDIESGIPVMLPDSSRVLSPDDWQSAMDRAGRSSEES